MATIQIRNNQWSLVHCFVPGIIEFPALSSKNVSTPPQSETFLKRPFLTDFKKETPPPTERNFGASDQKFKNPRKNAKIHRIGTF